MSRLQWQPVQATGFFNPIDGLNTSGAMMMRASQNTQQLNQNSIQNDQIIQSILDRQLSEMTGQDMTGASAAMAGGSRGGSSRGGSVGSTGSGGEGSVSDINQLAEYLSQGGSLQGSGINNPKDIKTYNDIGNTIGKELGSVHGFYNEQADAEKSKALLDIDALGLSPEDTALAKAEVEKQYLTTKQVNSVENSMGGRRAANQAGLPLGMQGLTPQQALASEVGVAPNTSSYAGYLPTDQRGDYAAQLEQMVSTPAGNTGGPVYATDVPQRDLRAELGRYTRPDVLVGVPDDAQVVAAGSGYAPPSVGGASADAQERYNNIQPMVRNAANTFGMNEGDLAGLIYMESSFQPTAKADSSSATGLGQHISSTWSDMVSKYGHLIDGPPDRNNPEHSLLMTAAYAKENSDKFTKQFGREPSMVETYAMYNLGYTGAQKFLTADDDKLIDSSVISDRAVKNNAGLYTDGNGNRLTVGQAKQVIGNRLDTGSQYAGVSQPVAAIPETTPEPEEVVPTRAEPTSVNEVDPRAELSTVLNGGQGVAKLGPFNISHLPQDKTKTTDSTSKETTEAKDSETGFVRDAWRRATSGKAGVIKDKTSGVKDLISKGEYGQAIGKALSAVPAFAMATGNDALNVTARPLADGLGKVVDGFMGNTDPDTKAEVKKVLESGASETEEKKELRKIAEKPLEINQFNYNSTLSNFQSQMAEVGGRIDTANTPMSGVELGKQIKDIANNTKVDRNEVNKGINILKKGYGLSNSEAIEVLNRATTVDGFLWASNSFDRVSYSNLAKDVKKESAARAKTRSAVTQTKNGFEKANKEYQEVQSKLDKELQYFEEKIAYNPAVPSVVRKQSEDRIATLKKRTDKLLKELGTHATEGQKIYLKYMSGNN